MELLKEFSHYLKQALEAMTGEAPELDICPPAQVDSPDPVFWWQQPITVNPGAVVWIGAAEAAWSGLGARVLAAAGGGDASDEDRRSKYIEVLQQAFSPLAHSIGLSLGREVACLPGSEAEKQPEHPAAELLVRYPGHPPLKLWIGFAPGLNPLVSGRTGAGEPQAAPPPDISADSSRTLDLLLEVELPVSISFGRAHVPLRDVLKLTSGSIVELNRGVQEPVEVIVNNCVIARGEVVVVEGNYGVKINQIVSRRERLRSLY